MEPERGAGTRPLTELERAIVDALPSFDFPGVQAPAIDEVVWSGPDD